MSIKQGQSHISHNEKGVFNVRWGTNLMHSIVLGSITIGSMTVLAVPVGVGKGIVENKESIFMSKI